MLTLRACRRHLPIFLHVGRSPLPQEPGLLRVVDAAIRQFLVPFITFPSEALKKG